MWVPRRPLGVKIQVWEPCVLEISTKRRISACGPQRVECAKASAIESQEVQRMEFNCVAIATASFRIDAVSFEWLEHTL